jgi:hypothetical protein
MTVLALFEGIASKAMKIVGFFPARLVEKPLLFSPKYALAWMSPTRQHQTL